MPLIPGLLVQFKTSQGSNESSHHEKGLHEGSWSSLLCTSIHEGVYLTNSQDLCASGSTLAKEFKCVGDNDKLIFRCAGHAL